MIYLILAVLSSTLMTLVMKFFRVQRGNHYGMILGNYIACIVIAFILVPDKKVLWHASASTLICGCISGFLFVAGLVSMQTSIAQNGATLTSAFAKLGLIVSLAMSIIVFGERPTLLQCLGILLVMGSLIVMNHDKSDGNHKSFMMLIVTLLCCGGGDAMAKVFEQVGQRSEDAGYFFFLFLTAAIVTSVLAFSEYHKKRKKIVPVEMAAGLLVGIPNYFSSSLLLYALTRLPAYVVYPSYSTGTILLVALVSAILFHERTGTWQKVGLVMILLALVLLNA